MNEKKIIDKINKLIEKYSLREKATEIQLNEEILKNGMSTQASILYGYKECYKDTIKEFENLRNEFE